jgi:hypothetical protein
MFGGPHVRSGLVQKISPQPSFEPLTFQPVASRYTDCAIPDATTELYVSELLNKMNRAGEHLGPGYAYMS